MEPNSLKYFDCAERLKTFGSKWNFDRQTDAKCTSKELSNAGFIYTEPDSAKCYVCQHEMVWEAQDEPAIEHKKHRPDCELVKIEHSEEDYTVEEVLRLMAFIHSTKKYPEMDEGIENLDAISEKLIVGTKKLL